MKNEIRPGDLAIIVNTTIHPEGMNGRIVVCERRVIPGETLHGIRLRFSRTNDWIISPVGGGTLPFLPTKQNPVRHLPSRPLGAQFLRPIRDPGDDAVDEMVLLLGKPQTIAQGVTA